MRFLRFSGAVHEQMVDRFPRVIPAGQSAGVLYLTDAGEVGPTSNSPTRWGDLWRRRYGEHPEPVLEDD